MHDRAHDQADHEVQQRDQQPCNRIPLDEFRRPVERSEECRFLLLTLPAFAGLLVADRTGGHVAVDCQLFAGHPVQREPGTDFGHPGRALGDHHEIDDQQHAEHDETQKNAAAHDEARKPLDHVACGPGSCVALSDDQLGRGHVQRQPQHERCQEDRRKGGKIEGSLDEERDREDQNGQRKGRREANVQHPGGHWQDHHHDDRHQGHREQDGRLENGAQGQAHPSTPRLLAFEVRSAPPPSVLGTSDPSRPGVPTPPAVSRGKAL